MEDLPEGWSKIQGFHGAGRDVYAAYTVFGQFQIWSKAAGSVEWFPGKSYRTEALLMEGFEALCEGLRQEGYNPTPLHIMESLPEFGRF